MSTTPSSLSLATLSFEEALSELETIVRRLEEGKVKLDEAVAAYERGTALKCYCETKLSEAQAKIESITVKSDGTIAKEPFSVA